MSLKRVADHRTVLEVERSVDAALVALRAVQRQGGSNTLAQVSIEYRLGRLQERKEQLQAAEGTRR